MKKRVTMIVILLMLSFGILFSSAQLPSENKAPHDDNKIIKDFLNTLRKLDTLSRAEFYYYNWEALSYSPIIHEEELKESAEIKVVLDSSRVRAPYYVRALEKAFEGLRLVRKEAKKVDYRIGCVFYAKDKEALRVFISKDNPVMNLNGVQYEVSLRLMKELMRNLPQNCVEEINSGMFKNWASISKEDMIKILEKEIPGSIEDINQ